MQLVINLLRRIYEMMLEKASSEKRVTYLRKKGIKIGQNCIINIMNFSTEPYLIEIGNKVRIASGTQFVTHDGSIRCFHDEIPGGVFGKIKIGSNVFIGINCIILLNTTIGNNCIVGAGSVVRGQFPDNSVIVGNPAKVISNINIQKMLFRNNPGFVKTNNLKEKEKNEIVKKHFNIK